MKLYYHPASTTSRPIMLYAEDNGLPLEYRLVDLFQGEQYKDEFVAVNPCHMVPVLEDGDFRLTESSAILKYLADTTGKAGYPKGARERARVNERMDWVNTQLARDFTYGFVYPQLLPMFKRKDEVVQQATVEWGRERARDWLGVLERHVLGDRAYLCGDELSIADYFAAPFVALGETIRCDYAPYPNLRRWLATMKARPSWRKVNETIDGFGKSLEGTAFVAL